MTRWLVAAGVLVWVGMCAAVAGVLWAVRGGCPCEEGA